MSCEDSGCPACRMAAVLIDLKEEGAEVPDVMGLFAHVVSEIYEVDVGYIGDKLETVH